MEDKKTIFVKDAAIFVKTLKHILKKHKDKRTISNDDVADFFGLDRKTIMYLSKGRRNISDQTISKVLTSDDITPRERNLIRKSLDMTQPLRSASKTGESEINTKLLLLPQEKKLECLDFVNDANIIDKLKQNTDTKDNEPQTTKQLALVDTSPTNVVDTIDANTGEITTISEYTSETTHPESKYTILEDARRLPWKYPARRITRLIPLGTSVYEFLQNAEISPDDWTLLCTETAHVNVEVLLRIIDTANVLSPAISAWLLAGFGGKNSGAPSEDLDRILKKTMEDSQWRENNNIGSE